VLVIHSGEAFRTGAPGGPLATPDYSGVLNNRLLIEAARGNRTFVSGSDADFHAIRGDSGLCPDAHCAAFDGALGYVIDAIDWAAGGAGLGVVSFYHGDFSGSFWWDDPNSFLRSELLGKWTNLIPDEDAVVIPATASGYAVNQGLTSAGLSNWFHSVHGGFSNLVGYASTADAVSAPGFSLSIATIDLCQPTAGTFCLAAIVNEPSSASLLTGAALLLIFALRARVGEPLVRPVLEGVI
jgi:hypothetical protein